MINYYCPDFYNGKNFYINFLECQKNYPKYFYDDVHIKYIYGAFTNMLWNGGTILTGNKVFPAEIYEIKNVYEKLEIPLQLTLTNSSLNEGHLSDPYCNQVLKILDNGINEVLVSTDLMYNFIKSEYPNYKINRSIVNTPKDYDWEKALEKYNNIVMPRRHLKNFEILNSIKNENRSHIELLCNDPCSNDCPYIYKHYKQYEELNLRRGPDIYNALKCENPNFKDKFLRISFEDQINIEEIFNKYLPIGYTEFKLSGRGTYFQVLLSIIPYMIKPKYQIEFIRYFIKFQ